MEASFHVHEGMLASTNIFSVVMIPLGLKRMKCRKECHKPWGAMAEKDGKRHIDDWHKLNLMIQIRH